WYPLRPRTAELGGWSEALRRVLGVRLECMPIYQLLRSKAITGFGKLGK
ncbi:unnamed protein product, partial [Ectocarpus sp. 12 AP-2014]